MIFTVLMTEIVERLVEVEVEAPSAEIAKQRAIDAYMESVDCGTARSSTSSIPLDSIIVKVVDEV